MLFYTDEHISFSFPGNIFFPPMEIKCLNTLKTEMSGVINLDVFFFLKGENQKRIWSIEFTYFELILRTLIWKKHIGRIV